MRTNTDTATGTNTNTDTATGTNTNTNASINPDSGTEVYFRDDTTKNCPELINVKLTFYLTCIGLTGEHDVSYLEKLEYYCFSITNTITTTTTTTATVVW